MLLLTGLQYLEPLITLYLVSRFFNPTILIFLTYENNP